jgi:CRP-like cAMP-binding protein
MVMPVMEKTGHIHHLASRKNSLCTLGLFRRIPQATLGELEKIMVEKSYGKRESLFLEDDPANSLWFVKTGHIKEVNHTPEGEDQTVSTAGPDGMFGVSAFDGGTYGFHCVAVTDVAAISFPIVNFQACMEKCTGLARAVLTQISLLLQKSKVKQSFGHERVEKRILLVLVELAGEFDGTIPLTRKEIAAMAGTTVETCIRTINLLAAAGLVAAGHSQLAVQSVEKLKLRMASL